MKTYNKIALVAIFILLPIGIYLFGNFPIRTTLKESFSITTLVAFFVMLLQFILSRLGRTISQEHKMAAILKWHKALGYVFVSILLFHPFFIVIPRYFEAGIAPVDAFVLILETYSKTPALLIGIIAWCVMLLIGITSFFRNNLGMSYTTWRVVHGILSILFIVLADIHILSLGRHINAGMSFMILFLSLIGIGLLLRTYFIKSPQKKAQHEIK